MFALTRSGPFLMILASAAFTTMVACARVARQDFGGLELVFWRGVISLPLLLLVGRELNLTLRRHRGTFAIRAVLGFLAMSCFYTAARDVDLLTLSLIMRLQPILVTLAAPWILGRTESAGAGGVVAAIVGFAGSALLIAPDLEAGSWSILFAVAAPILSAGAHLALRRVSVENPSRAIVFWFHLSMIPLAFGGVAGQGQSISLPTGSMAVFVLGVGVCATAGQLLMTRAYKLERAPLVAAASYTGVLWALAYDVLFFDEIPSLLAIPGGALVIGSSLWLILRGQRRRAVGLAS